MNQINASKLKELLAQNQSEVELLDVRTSSEYTSAHVRGAINLTMGSPELESYIKKQSEKNSPLYILCQGGGRASKVCDSFKGINKNLVLVEGGTKACISEGLPIVEGKGCMSLERQVRIAAGSLVLLGVILSIYCCPTAIYLSGFVGAGLIFAGVTDTCGMAMMLAKMPWNNKSESKSCCSL